MKYKILSVLKSCKGRAGYYGITLQNLSQRMKLDYWVPIPDIFLLEMNNQIFIHRSTQENNRGEITLICYRES